VARQIRTEQGDELHRATGTPVHPMSPLTKLAWFARHPPRPAARWCGLKDYVAAEFTGHLVIDQSCASATGLLDIERLTWHPAALATAGIDAGQLPELVPPTHILPLAPGPARAMNLRAGLPVVTGAGDGPLANLGVGALAPGLAALSLGTSGALRIVRDHPGVDPGHRTFCYYLADGQWVVGGAVSNGGLVGQWAADLFGADLPHLLTEAAGASAVGLLALPYLLGERAPWWDAGLTGALIGLRRSHSRAEITRALLEGVAQQLALIRDAMTDAGAEVTAIRASGGAFRAPVWPAVLAAALNTPLQIVTAGGSAVGAAAVGRLALGDIPSLAAAAESITSGLSAVAVVPVASEAERLAGERPLIEELHRLLRHRKITQTSP
jgi:gluconokinase